MNKVKATAAGIFVLLVIGLGFMSGTIVGATERGIVHTWGKPSEEIKTPGMHIIFPIAQTMKKWTVVPQVHPVTISIDEDAAISRDNQSLGTSVRLMWAFDEARLYEAATQFSKPVIERALTAITISSIKQVIGRYTIFDIAVSQDTITQLLSQRIKSQIGQYPISITQVTVENFDWSDAFDRQIQATMEATQAVRKAEQDANISEQQMRRLTIEATAKASALEAEATGRLKAAELDAKATIERAKAQNEANRLLAQNLNVEVRIRELEIAKIEAEKFDGRRVPSYLPLNPAGGIVTLPAVK